MKIIPKLTACLIASLLISCNSSDEKFVGEWTQDLGDEYPDVDMKITRDGDGYLIETNRGDGMASRDGDRLDTGTIAGAITFSSDGKRAYFDGVEYYRIPKELKVDHEAARKACVLNIRNVQQAIRGYANMQQLNYGERIDWNKIFGDDGYLGKPTCPIGGVYSFTRNIPDIGVPACTCSHARKYNHKPDSHEHW